MPNLSNEIIAAAQSAQAKWAVPASVTLAQYGVESSWGVHMPAGSLNPFGIKATGSQPFVTSKTREVIKGKSIYTQDKFRKFSSMAAAFDAHAQLLATKSIYRPAMTAWAAGNLERGIRLMASKYATDPHYAASLIAIIGVDKLGAYDKKVSASAPTAATYDFPVKGVRKNEVVAQVQRRLKELGYSEVGNTDGNFGDMTEKAILIFDHDADLPLTGEIDSQLLVALTTAQARKLPEARTEATPSQIRDKVPEAKSTWFTKVIALFGAGFTGVGAGINWLISSFSQARDTVSPITDMLGYVPLWAWIGLFAVGFLSVWLMTQHSGKQIATAYQEGSRR